MALLKNIFGIREIKEPLFYKDFSEENNQLNEMINLSEKVKSDKKEIIERDITFLKAGIKGEKNVYYELKNSFIPMICLHDIRLDDGDYTAQLDFVVITAQFIMILETKKLNGDIYINESGDFIRYIKNRNGKLIKKEGIYSPVAQNDRHVRIVKNLLINKGIIKTVPVLSGVVIANEKSIVNKSEAPAKVKNEILRFDQLTDFINSKIDQHKEEKNLFEDIMRNIANFFKYNNKETGYDYRTKYGLTDADFIETIMDYEEDREAACTNEVSEITEDILEVNIEELYNKLKEYRLNKARELGIKPYFIYSNETMGQIVAAMPNSKEELIKIRGFGEKKVEQYGDDIVGIFKLV